MPINNNPALNNSTSNCDSESKSSLYKIAAIIAASVLIAVSLASKEITFTIWVGAAAVFFVLLNKELRLYYVLLICIILLLGALGFLNFNLFYQVAQYTYNENVTPAYLFSVGHVHALRFTVMYPVVMITRLTNLNEDAVFSLFCFLLVIPGIIISIYSYLKNLIKMNPGYKILIAALVICTAHFMNGRALLSFLGIALIMYVMGESLTKSASSESFIFTVKYTVICVLGVFLSSVSSGTIICACLVLLTGIILIKRRNCRFTPVSVTIILVFGIFIGMHIWQMIQKNLATYNYNILNMLWHGLGSVLQISLIILVGAVALMCVVLPFYYVLAFNVYKRNVLAGYAVVLLPLLGICGMFGRTTATMALIPLLVCAVYLISKFFSMPVFKRREKEIKAKIQKA